MYLRGFLEMKFELSGEFEHFSHPHLLSLQENWRGDLAKCKACEYACVGPTYSCIQCVFRLHESCAKLPRKHENYSLHPHPLTLQTDQLFRCNVCANYKTGFRFHCDECNVSLDVNCAFMRPAIEERDEQHGAHFRHHHSLVCFENIPKNHVTCRVCGKYCSDPRSYGCLKCKCFTHPSCFALKLQRKIQHFFHPCPLTLYTNPNGPFTCRACRKFWFSGPFYYGCKRCDFRMDIDCALLPTTESDQNGEEQICNVHHGHPLSLFKITEGRQVYCNVCGEACTDPTYACDRSFCKKAFIHKSCLQVPLEMYHPFHPYHRLTLKQSLRFEDCNACRKHLNLDYGSIYECDDCAFVLHVECSLTRNAVIYDGHSHILQFKDNIDDDQFMKCTACKSSCESYGFSCLYCDFDFDLRCGPLPYKIKHECHIDPLVLTHGLAEYEDVNDDEFYCDACEEIRDQPLSLNYQCTECQFVADLECVEPEVIASLNGKYGDVELRDRFGRFGKVISTQDTVKEMAQKKNVQAVTLCNILKSFSEEEKNELYSVLKVGEMVTPSADDQNILSYDYDEVLNDEVLESSDKGYAKFIRFLDQCGKRLHIDYPDKRLSKDSISDDEFPYLLAFKEEVVNVGDYMVTRKLAPILKDLLSKHEDICVDSTLSPRVKLYLFNMLCESIHSMRHHHVVQITDYLLLNWWGSLEILRFAGFRVEFAFDRLRRVAHAYFGSKVTRKVADAAVKLNGEIAELYEKIKMLEEKRDRIESRKSSSLEKCMKEALVLKLDKVSGNGLL